MKYTTPQYHIEIVEAKNVITASLISEEVNPENPNYVSYGTKAEYILGY